MLEPWQRTTDTSIEQFAHFISFLVANELLSDALAHLKRADLSNIRVSYLHILAVQDFLRERYNSGDHRARGANAIILSAHVENVTSQTISAICFSTAYERSSAKMSSTSTV